jgi:hypothetical protein
LENHLRSFEAPANEFLLFLSAIESNRAIGDFDGPVPEHEKEVEDIVPEIVTKAFVGNELKALGIVSAKVPKGNSYNFIN